MDTLWQNERENTPGTSDVRVASFGPATKNILAYYEGSRHSTPVTRVLLAPSGRHI